MKTAVVYASTHHGNTKKLVDAIAENENIDIVNSVDIKEYDLQNYDLIGFASGVAFGKYYPQILQFMEDNLPNEKKIFFIHTAGSPRENQNSAAMAVAEKKQCVCLGTYFCKGFDTFGPFKLVGGISKGHPNSEETKGAVDFFNNLSTY